MAAPPGHEDELRAGRRGGRARGCRVTVVTGGASRSESVADRARGVPSGDVSWSTTRRGRCVEAELVDRCVERLEHWGCDGVVAAARAVDTIKEADAGGRVLATLERASLWAVQTPQVFGAEALRARARRRRTSSAPTTTRSWSRRPAATCASSRRRVTISRSRRPPTSGSRSCCWPTARSDRSASAC